MALFVGVDALQAVVNFMIAHGSTLPEEHRTHLSKELTTPDFLRKVIVGMETLYAVREDLNSEGLELFHDLASFVQAHGFYGMADRALSLILVASRVKNGGVAILESDPEVNKEYTYNPPEQMPAPTPPTPPAPVEEPIEEDE